MSITLTRGKVLDAISMDAGGSGYTYATATTTGNAVLGISPTASGAVTGVPIIDPGDSYATAPEIAFDGDGSLADATATVKDGDINIIRKIYVQDYYESGATIIAASPYNRVQKAQFYDDATLQMFADQVFDEEPKLFQAYVTQDGATVPALSYDPTIALYRLVRIKAWQNMLTNRDYLAAMYSGAGGIEVIDRLIAQMTRQMKQDRSYATNTGGFPNSCELERA
jgi:hypothetical protein